MDPAALITEGKSFEENPSLFQYSRDYNHVGKCLIINNENFDVMSQRKGTEVDRMLVQRTFTSLKFTVQVENDLSADDMLKALQRVSEEDHTDMACFVCVLLSHGENGTLWGTDRQVPLRSLTSVLSAKRCPSLEGKPKLFFIQACRGRECDPGVETVETDSAEEKQPAQTTEIPEGDFLCSYSTVPGYFSWRNQMTGSTYIRYLCEMLKLNKHLEITKILTRDPRAHLNHEPEIVDFSPPGLGVYRSYQKNFPKAILASGNAGCTLIGQTFPCILCHKMVTAEFKYNVLNCESAGVVKV